MEQYRISPEDMLLFAAVAEAGSLVRAAERLSMPKATVSRRLSNLEAGLAQQLMVRTTRRLTLTDFGQAFLEQCQRVAEEVEAASDFARSQERQPRGRLRVSMPGDYAQLRLAGAIATFVERYPEVQLDLDLTSRRVDLVGEQFDMVIRMGGLGNDATLVARKIDEQVFGLYASPIYLGLHPAPPEPSELMAHHCVRLMSAHGTAVPWKLMRGEEVWEAQPPGRLTVNSPGVIQQLLLDGVGIGALPQHFAERDVRSGCLVRVLPEWHFPPVPAWAVMPTRRYLPVKTRAFLEHIRSALGAA